MNRNLHDIDNLFTQFLKDHKEAPPQNLWQQIENDLNRKDAEKYKTKYKSLKRIFISVILTCICLLLGDVLQLNMGNVRNEVCDLTSLHKKNLKANNRN